MAKRASCKILIASMLVAGLASALPGPAAGAEPDVFANAWPYYSKWTKACVDDQGSNACLTVREVRNDSGQRMFSVAVAEVKGKPPTLRILLPVGMQLMHGVELTLDQGAPMRSPYVYCSRDGCVSQFELDSDLINRVRTARELAVRVFDTHGRGLRLPLPLTGFAPAYAGRPGDIDAIDRSQKAIQGKPSKDFAADPHVLALPAPALDNASEEPLLRLMPWTKFCSRGKDGNGAQVCFTGKQGRMQAGTLAVAAVLIEPESEPKKILRLTLPLGMQIGPGTQLSIDDDPISQKPYVICTSTGCISDHDAGAGLIDKLKVGQNLLIQAINGEGRDVKLRLPLLGFSKVFEGPPVDPTEFEAAKRNLQ